MHLYYENWGVSVSYTTQGKLRFERLIGTRESHPIHKENRVCPQMFKELLHPRGRFFSLLFWAHSFLYSSIKHATFWAETFQAEIIKVLF